MFSGLEKILDLIGKTGDKFIVSRENRNYVLMPLEQYEKLIISHNQTTDHLQELSEDEMIERINQEIAAWREVQAAEIDWPYLAEKQRDEEAKVDDENYYLEPID